MAGGQATGLIKRGNDGEFVVQLLKLGDVVPIEADVDAEEFLDYVHGLAGERADGGVVDGEDGDRITAVDGIVELGLGEVVRKGAELRVLREDLGDVKGRRESEEGEEEEDD